MKNKRFYIRKLAEVVRSHFKEYHAEQRYKGLRQSYGATRHYLPEFNKLCIHRNLPSVVRSLSDYKLARFLMSSYVSKEPVWQGRFDFTRWHYDHREALVLWLYKLPQHKGNLPHIAEEYISHERRDPDFEMTDLVIEKGLVPEKGKNRRKRKRSDNRMSAYKRKIASKTNSKQTPK